MVFLPEKMKTSKQMGGEKQYEKQLMMSSELLPSASYTLLNLTEKLNNFNPGCQGRVIYHVFAPQREADFQPMHF